MDFIAFAQGAWPEKGGIHPPDVRTTWQLPSELGQLTALYRLALGGPLLTGAIPPELGQLANLEQLTLAGSRLTGAVPPELGQLTRLRKLELHDNRLTALPPELGQLPYLEALDVQDNQLTALPSLAGLTLLEYLDLSGNLLTTLPPGIEQLPILEHLDLSDNRLTTLPSAWLRPRWSTVVDTGAGFLFYKMVDLVKHGTAGLLSPGSLLKVLDLSGNQLPDLPAALFLLDRLQGLNLSGNQLGTVPPAIGDLTTLETLGLDDNQLTTLPPELAQLPQLVSLDLSGNRLTRLSDPAVDSEQAARWPRRLPVAPALADRPVYLSAELQLERCPFLDHVNFDYRLLSPMSGTEPSDLPFLDLCPE